MKGKRFFLYGMVLLTAVISAVALSGCGSSGTEEGTVTVTFCAAGEEDIVLTTEYGGSITPPKVPAKTGNEGRWDTEAFDEIRQDMTVNAIYETQGLEYTDYYGGGLGRYYTVTYLYGHFLKKECKIYLVYSKCF